MYPLNSTLLPLLENITSVDQKVKIYSEMSVMGWGRGEKRKKSTYITFDGSPWHSTDTVHCNVK